MGVIVSPPPGGASTTLRPSVLGLAMWSFDILEAINVDSTTNEALVCVLCMASQTVTINHIGCWQTVAGVTPGKLPI